MEEVHQRNSRLNEDSDKGLISTVTLPTLPNSSMKQLPHAVVIGKHANEANTGIDI